MILLIPCRITLAICSFVTPFPKRLCIPKASYKTEYLQKPLPRSFWKSINPEAHLRSSWWLYLVSFRSAQLVAITYVRILRRRLNLQRMIYPWTHPSLGTWFYRRIESLVLSEPSLLCSRSDNFVDKYSWRNQLDTVKCQLLGQMSQIFLSTHNQSPACYTAKTASHNDSKWTSWSLFSCICS